MKRGQKGKRRRAKAKYAEMDEEDLEIHRIAVGHAQIEEEETHPAVSESEVANRTRTEETIKSALRGDAGAMLEKLPPSVRAGLDALVEQSLLELSELDTYELGTLASLPAEGALEAVRCFQQADLRKIGNKSGLLAGIMRRVAKASASGGGSAGGGSGGNEADGPRSAAEESELGNVRPDESRTAHKKRMEAEERKLLEVCCGVRVAWHGFGEVNAGVQRTLGRDGSDTCACCS